MHHAAAHRDGLDPAVGRELQQEQPDTAAGAQDQQPVTRVQRQPGQDHVGSPGGERGSGSIGKRCAGVDPGNQISVHDSQLRVPAAAVREMRHCHHPVPDGQAGNPGPEALHDAGDVVAEDARHRKACPAAVGPVKCVHRVGARGVNRDPDVALAGHRICGIGQKQLLGAAEFADNHCPHPATLQPHARPSTTIASPAVSRGQYHMPLPPRAHGLEGEAGAVQCSRTGNRPVGGIMWVIEDHLRPSGYIMLVHAGDRGAERPSWSLTITSITSMRVNCPGCATPTSEGSRRSTPRPCHRAGEGRAGAGCCACSCSWLPAGSSSDGIRKWWPATQRNATQSTGPSVLFSEKRSVTSAGTSHSGQDMTVSTALIS